VGGARTALFNWLFARKNGGSFILRIEDTDRARSQPEFLEQILESLRWLGLDWDEGPEVGGSFGPYLQSERLDLYRHYLGHLLDSGWAYPCYCTKEELAAEREQQVKEKQPPKYGGRCRYLSEEKRKEFEAEGRPRVFRFRMKEEGEVVVRDLIRGDVAFDLSLLDDFVLFKSDGYPTFLMANAVDDHEMKITHVLRGEEHLSNTPRLLVLSEALGFAGGPKYAHAPILLNAQRAKLSKREGATSVLEFRDQGYFPSAVRNFLALLGWSPDSGEEILSDEEMIERFSLEGISKSGAIFDLQKLEWTNAEHLRRAPTEELVSLALPYLQRERLVSSPPAEGEREKVQKVLELMRERIKLLSQLPQACAFFFRDPDRYEEKAARKWFSPAEPSERLLQLAEVFEALPEWSVEAIENVVRKLAEEKEIAASALIHPARLAITGASVGPSLFHLMEVVGKEICLRRLRRAAAISQP
jgi:glutamyl-tRNA synthetase